MSGKVPLSSYSTSTLNPMVPFCFILQQTLNENFKRMTRFFFIFYCTIITENIYKIRDRFHFSDINMTTMGPVQSVCFHTYSRYTPTVQICNKIDIIINLPRLCQGPWYCPCLLCPFPAKLSPVWTMGVVSILLAQPSRCHWNAT